MTTANRGAAQARPRAPAPRLSLLDGALVLVMILWAGHYAVAKAAIDVLPPMVYNALRFSLAAVAVGTFLKATGHRLVLPRREWGAIIRAAFLSFALYQWFFINGLRHTAVSNSVLITTAAPVWLVLYNIWRRRERGSRRIYTGVIMALGGVLVVIVSRYTGAFDFGGENILGDALMIISTFLWALMILALREPLSNNPAMVTNFWTLVWGGVFGTLLAVPDLVVLDWSLLNTDVVLAILYASLLAVAFAGTLWTIGLQRLGSSRTAIYVNIQPVAAAMIAVLFLGEPFTPWLVIGIVLVLVGMWRLRLG
jgi:drug/metabolite transporter (DMT)-like permease